MSQADAGWRAQTPEFLSYLADLVAQVLRDDAELAPDTADIIGYEVMRRFCETFGGVQTYIPKADSLAICDKHSRIWADFDGRNQAELARQYKISQVHVYRIIKTMRARDIKNRQGELPL